MNGLIAWFAENKIAANLITIFVMIAGVISLQDTRKEILPNISLDLITITVPYVGASPEDVENTVLSRIESAVYDLEGVKSLNTKALENVGLVTIEVDYGYDTKYLLNEIKARVDGIGSFPKDVGRPIIREISVRNLVAYMMISGPADEASLMNLAQHVKQDLTSLPHISQVEMAAQRPQEIAINVSERELERYGLSFFEVVNAIRSSAMDLPTGIVKTGQGDVSVKAKGQVYMGDDFGDIAVRAMPDGSQILVRDVAKVTDGFQDGDALSRYNGQPAVALAVYRVGNQSILDISKELHEYAKHPGTYIPDGVKVNVWQDTSVYFKSRMDLLSSNALSGLAVVFIMLLLFLRFKLSFWVSVGIPFSFMGAFWVLPHLGGSLNMISMFALILVLGIVVDDAIVVSENIFTHHRNGIKGTKGAISGTQEVANPVIFSVLTTVVAFLPLVFLPGPEGKLMRVIPIVVISVLVFSLLESLLCLPAHVSHISDERFDRFPVVGKVQEKFADLLDRFLGKVYSPFLELCLRWRYTVLFAFVAALLISLSLIAAGWVKVVFFSTIEADTASASVSFSQNSTPQVVHSGILKIEKAAMDLQRDLKRETGKEQILNVFTSFVGDHAGRLVIEMAPSESRKLSGEQVIAEWRKRVGDLPEVTSLDFSATLTQPGDLIDLELASSSMEDLRQAADGLKEQLIKDKGLYDIRDSFQKGKQELSIELKPVARNLGLSLDDVAMQVRQAYNGVDVQNLQRGDQDLKVVVRYNAKERSSLWYLENMSIQLRDGSRVPLLTVADIQYGMGPAQIDRHNRRRVIQVTAKVDDSITSPGKVMDDLQKGYLSTLSAHYPGMSWSVAGAQKEKEEFKDFLVKAYVFALMAMYVMMAVLFRSYAQPLMVMSAIPFGLIGALLGHMLMGLELTLWSLVGMIAVSGVVVNDNLVLVDFMNSNRAKGISLMESIRDAGVARFRPIILTSITTFGGLAPLMMEKSLQAKFLIPMAVSLAFGVMFATLISLILIPALYYIVYDFETIVMKIFGRKSAEGHESESAAAELDRGFTPETADDSGKLQWHIGLDEAYEQGYKDGLKGDIPRQAPFDLEVLVASWEAGWDDGHEEFLLQQDSGAHNPG